LVGIILRNEGEAVKSVEGMMAFLCGEDTVYDDSARKHLGNARGLAESLPTH
jgi:hypothetical protein